MNGMSSNGFQAFAKKCNIPEKNFCVLDDEADIGMSLMINMFIIQSVQMDPTLIC